MKMKMKEKQKMKQKMKMNPDEMSCPGIKPALSKVVDAEAQYSLSSLIDIIVAEIRLWKQADSSVPAASECTGTGRRGVIAGAGAISAGP